MHELFACVNNGRKRLIARTRFRDFKNCVLLVVCIACKTTSSLYLFSQEFDLDCFQSHQTQLIDKVHEIIKLALKVTRQSFALQLYFLRLICSGNVCLAETSSLLLAH